MGGERWGSQLEGVIPVSEGGVFRKIRSVEVSPSPTGEVSKVTGGVTHDCQESIRGVPG